MGALLVVVAAVVVGFASAPAAKAARPALKPVPSLDPVGTQRLWKKLVRRPRVFSRADITDCRPLRAVFYTSTDWLRLATKLAANPSPCAQYYISIPPLAADKTKFRYDQPWRIRALGPQFHVLAEINYTGWSNWVATTGASWYDAGLEARRRMAENGFDVAAGDTWVVNEASSAVRRNVGAARTNLRELVRGLHDGDGTVPAVKGAVFIVGIAQSTGDLGPYKVYLQDWLTDSAFWNDMSAYVSDWSQELYGDAREYAVAGASAQTRRDYLNDYLQHELTLANAGPETVAPARSFIQSAYSPLANAAWMWETSFGYTNVTVDQMKDYVSGQTYALRSFDARNGLAEDHFGFAWAPRNAGGTAWTTDYTTQSGELIDRLAAAIADSGGTTDPGDAGIGACGPLGQNLWCSAAVDGAAFVESWKTFTTWSPAALGFATAPVTVTAGEASPPITVRLQTAGIADADVNPVTVTLSSSSATGTFSTSATGPWTSTLDVTIPAGATASDAVYYRDTTAGTATLTATAAGRQSATQTATVNAAALASLTVSPASSTLFTRGTETFTATGADAYGNAVAVAPAWTLAAGTPGTLSAASGASTTFTASSSTAGSGSITATDGTVTATAPITVNLSKLRVGSITYAISSGRLVVTTTVVNGTTGVPVAGASLSLLIYRGSSLWASGSGTTGSTGKLTLTTSSSTPSGCYTTRIRTASAQGYSWDGTTPANSFCK